MNPLISLSPGAALQSAGSNLAHFVDVQAEAMAQLAGFRWGGDAAAPNDYGSLLKAYARSRLTGRPLPVSNQFSDTTIYGTLEANLAFRFWHDLTHLRLGRSFALDDEIEVAGAHLDVLRAVGFGPGSLEFELLHADTMGQALCSAATGSFPGEQLCFARLTIESGLNTAIRAELTPSEAQAYSDQLSGS